MQRYVHYIDGEDTPPQNQRWFESHNPYTGEVWAEIAEGSAVDADLAVQAAHRGEHPRGRAHREGTAAVVEAARRAQDLGWL